MVHTLQTCSHTNDGSCILCIAIELNEYLCGVFCESPTLLCVLLWLFSVVFVWWEPGVGLTVKLKILGS